MTALIVAEAVVIVFLTTLVVGLLRSHAEVLRKLHELGAGEDGSAPFQTAPGVPEPRMTGSTAHDISGSTPAGGATGIRVVQSNQPTLLAFMSTTCPTCGHFWAQFDQPEVVATLGSTRLVIVTKSATDEMPAELARLAPAGVPVAMSSEAWQDYKVPGSPYFVLVDGTSGMVTGEGSAGTWEKLLDLMGVAGGEVNVDSAAVTDHDRAERIDQELADAGILPGDPKLYGEHELQADGE